MKNAMKWAFAVLLSAGQCLAETYSREDESGHWQQIFNNIGNQPLNSSEPISVKITGPADAEGYPTGEIYYNDVYACDNTYYRYFPSFVSFVDGQGWSPDYDDFNSTSLVKDSKGVFNYGWVVNKNEFESTSADWLDGGAISFYGDCGSHKIGVSIKDIIKMAEKENNSVRKRARLTIDRLLYSSQSLADLHNGSSMWRYGSVDLDESRYGRAYYYLYLTKSTVYDHWSCKKGTVNCTIHQVNVNKDDIINLSLVVKVADYASVKVTDQRRHYTLANGKYVAGNWETDSVYSCYGYSKDRFLGRPCSDYNAFQITREDVADRGDSLVEFRRLWQTTIATGPSKDGPHAMEVYDTTYSDTVKLVPMYKVDISSEDRGVERSMIRYKTSDNADWSYSTNDNNMNAGKTITVQAVSKAGYKFSYWAESSTGRKVSDKNPLSLTVRGDTSLYAVCDETPLKVTMKAQKWNHTYHDGYDHVRGRDSVGFNGAVYGTDKTAYFACEYRDASSTAWKRLGKIQEIPASVIAVGSGVYIDIDKAGEVVCRYGNTTVLGKQELSKIDSTEFRFALSDDPDMMDAIYSDINYVQPRFPVVFRDTNYEVVYDKPAKWGESVELPTKAELKIPEDDIEKGIYYDFAWWDISLDMDSECRRSIKSQDVSWKFSSTLDSLNCFPAVLKGYRVKFIGAGDTVLKDTIVKEVLGQISVMSTYTSAPEVPKYEALRFKGWDHEVNSLNNITDVTEPMIVKALFDSIYYVVFIDLVSGHSLRKDTLDYGESPTEIPEVPEYADYTFKEWTEDATKIKRPLEGMGHYANVYAVYDVPENKEFKFTVSGIGTAKMLDDIKVEHNLNECFDVSQELAVGGERPQEITGYMSYRFAIKVNPKDTYECIDDSLVKVWNYFERLEGWAGYSKWPVIVNGVDVSRNTWIYGSDSVVVNYGLYEVWFVDDDRERTVLKKELVGEGLSATPPEDPKRDGYVFVGWDTDDFDYVTEEMMVVAQYEEVESSSSEAKSSSSEAKSSSSKNKSSSSSSKGKDSKSSSSKGGKDAIVAVQQVPQFSLVAAGRDIQVAGARMGSAYAVFDMQGHVMVKGRVAAANFDVPVSRAGSYLVRIGNQVQKVNIK